MIDLVLTIIFAYQLHRMSKNRGIPSLPYVMNYVVAIIIMAVSMAFVFIYFYGIDALKSEKGIQAAMLFEPVAISFEVLLFIYFRQRIQKAVVNDQTEEEDNDKKPDSGEKKDLSYFR
ncbi:MAG: hypothetical protein IPP77_10450 [Bacteroidetes bacterium]|nr:hypothetical protein [Bacteroidota bacterium]